MNVRTFTLLELTNKDADFTSDTVDVQRDLGYSVTIKTSSASADLVGTIKLQAANDGDWGDIQGTISNVVQDDVIIYNVSAVYYKYFRVNTTISSGDADFLIFVTTKSG